jgi:multimeric flavodoxin WrbA
MTRTAVAYHSAFGHTAAVARSVVEGLASVPGVEAVAVDVTTLPPADAQRRLTGAWEDLHRADAIVFGCPTYMGTVTAPFKAFMDATGAIWQTQAWRDKLAAGFTNAAGLSGDKLQTLQALSVFAAQHSMVWVSQGVMMAPGGINRMGSYLGLMAQSDNAPTNRTPPPEDHATARLFGARVGEAAARWARGRA